MPVGIWMVDPLLEQVTRVAGVAGVVTFPSASLTSATPPARAMVPAEFRQAPAKEAIDPAALAAALRREESTYPRYSGTATAAKAATITATTITSTRVKPRWPFFL